MRKEGEEKGEVVVVEEKSPNKEGASGPAGFGPQAQSGEARGRCKGPISGSTRDPALHRSAGLDACCTWNGFTLHQKLRRVRGYVISGLI